MTQEQLKAIKEDVKKLHVFFEALLEVWSSHENTMISVLLQNMAFDGSNTVNYTLEGAVKELNDIKAALYAFGQYSGKDNYLIGFINEQIEMSYMGNMYEDDFEQPEI